ncbi:MAG: toll/interleukin-1 receptor domain-containing protein [Lachnospiraceae bacterium]|nr:toll/interleukin-1 receptor domain-containing protein [Lachnospiraceae bacterium]
MAKDSVKYDAFISYRHSELDSFVAETLHKQLENFKLPRDVVRSKTSETEKTEREPSETKPVKTRIQRVFRDKEELPLVTNLADPITEALANSEYLIVICSPRLLESMWCRKEIETFIEMHDREHVLAVLVEGEPDTSFPEELLYREEEERQPDGSIIKTRVPVEPLAADVRGTKRGEIRKKIKSELLRLVAPMFDCNYDDLKQRHKEQRTRKIIMTSMSISAACLLFGIVSITMAMQIKYQNTQIREQNTQIKMQSEEISKQAQEIEEQYLEAKRNTAVSRSREAVRYLDEGDRMKAVATAQDAICDLSEEGGIEAGVDYPAEAVYALSDSLYLYENGQQILPDRILEADTTVRVMKISPEGSRILTVDASGQAVVWQPDDNNVRINLNLSYRLSDMENMVAFYGEDCLFAPTEDEVAAYDLSQDTATEAYRIACEDYVGIIVLQERKQAVILSENGYQAIDCTDGSTIYEGQWDIDGMIARGTLAWACSEDNRYWAVSLAPPHSAGEEDDRIVVVYDAEGVQLRAYEIGYEYVKSLRFDGDRIYVVSNHSGEKDITRVTLGMESRLQAFDINGADGPVWTYERHNGWLYETSYAHAENSNYLLCSGYSDVVALDKRDGSYIDVFAFGVEVVKLGNYVGSDNFVAFTRDGVWHYLSMERREDMVGTLFPASTSTNVKNFAIGDGYCVTLPYNSRQVTVYRTARGAGIEEVYQGDYNYRKAEFSSDGRYMAAPFYNDNYSAALEMFDLDTGERIWSYENESSYKDIAFFDYNGQEKLALLTDEQMIVLEPEQGTCLEEVSLRMERTFDYLGCYRRDNEEHAKDYYFFWWDGEKIYGYDLTRMDYAYEIQPEEEIGYNDVIAIQHDMQEYVVVDKEDGVLRFCNMEDGEEFFTYGEGQDSSQPDYINAEYIETVFFDEWEMDRHLYIVYMDRRITRLDIGGNDPAQYCTSDSHNRNPEKYNGLDDVMRGYIDAGDYAIMRGNIDAYLLTSHEGDILAHMHGFLGYDSTAGQIYLTNSRTIYRIPLYTLEEINEIATDVRRTGQWQVNSAGGMP